MRGKTNELLKQELRVLAIQTRDRLSLSQGEMAERLMMQEHSYSDIETGRYMCGTLTVVLLLLEQDDPAVFLHTLEQEFKELWEKEMLPI